MDSRLQQASVAGDVPALLALVQDDRSIVEQRDLTTGNTALHLSSRLGHAEFVSELVKLKPELVSAENTNRETALHMACCDGHLAVVDLLLNADPKVAYRLDGQNRSALFMACVRGHDLVAVCLLEPRLGPLLLGLEDDGTSTSLHAATSRGLTEICREILKYRPDFVWRRDEQGLYPIHLASNKGHLEITQELLGVDSELCSVMDRKGMAPFHLAAIKGFVPILGEIFSGRRHLVDRPTLHGDSVLHLAVKYGKLEALKYILANYHVAGLINIRDGLGNTVLHLAVAAKLPPMVDFLAKRSDIDINAVNDHQKTALDVAISMEKDDDGWAPYLATSLKGLGARSSVDESSPKAFVANVGGSRHKQLVLPAGYIEGLHNARNTIAVIAVLIATVTYAAGINPPGGFYQDGEMAGKSIAAAKFRSFKVFLIFNNVALFLSISIVMILASILPFRIEPLKTQLKITHKLMWASIATMVVAYFAAMLVVLPNSMKWEVGIVMAVCVGLITLTFVGLVLFKMRKKFNSRQNDKIASPRLDETIVLAR